MTEYDPIKLLQQRDAALEDRLNALAERISSVAKQVADLIVIVSRLHDVTPQPARKFEDAILDLRFPAIASGSTEKIERVWDEQPSAIHG